MPDDEASIGVSMFIAVQNYTATGGGLPKAIRGNCTHMALWRTKNTDELNLIAKEMAGEVSPEKFLEVYHFIMADEEDKHVMMFLDLFAHLCFAVIIQNSLLCKVTRRQQQVSRHGHL